MKEVAMKQAFLRSLALVAGAALTTLVQAMAEQKHISAADAETAVKSVLNITGVSSLTSYDPLAAITAGGAGVAIER